MNSLDHLLDERAARDERGRRVVAAIVATTLHGLLVAGAIWGPKLFADPVKPVEYLPVTLLPPPAQGVRNPAPARPTPKPAEPATPQPEPPQPEPPKAEAPKPAAADQPPALTPPKPSPTKTPPAAPTPAPASAANDAAEDPRRTGTVPGRLGSPNGRPDSAFTEGAAVAGLDNPDFRYAYYVDRMAAMIRGQWTRPPVGSGIEVAIHFIVERNGSVREVEIVRSSGSAAFDLAGRRAVESAAPLPPLPKGYAGDTLGVTLLFR